MPFVHFDKSYVPCGFLIVKDGRKSVYDDENTVLIQSDWDFPGVASSMGWIPCENCERTDGTVDCEHKQKSQMMSEAYDFIWKKKGKKFSTLNEYF